MESPDTEALEHFLESGKIGRDYHVGIMYLQGADGHYYPGHELGSDLIALPIAYVARWTGGNYPFRRVFELEVGFAGALVFATTFFLGLQLAARLAVPDSFSVWHLFFLLVSSQYLVYGFHLADISLSCPLFIGIAILWVDIESGTKQQTRWILLGLCCGFLILCKLTNLALIPVLAFLAVRKMVRDRSWLLPELTAAIAGALPGLLLTGWWNWFRSGSPFKTLYLDTEHGFDAGQLLHGLGGTLIGPGSSIFLYSPFLILALPYLLRPCHSRAWNSLRILSLGSMAIAIVRLSGMPTWNSVNGWGIRYYVPWLPLLAVLATAIWWQHRHSRVWRIAAPTLIFCGMLLNLGGTLASWHYMEARCGLPDWNSRMPVCAISGLADNLARVFGSTKPDVVVETAPKELVFISNRLDVWWFAMQTQGIPKAVSWMVGLVLIGSLVVLGFRIHALNHSGAVSKTS